VALNCVANGKVLRAGNFEKIWVQPAAGDAGGALGAALTAWYQILKQPRVATAYGPSLLGPHAHNLDIPAFLRRHQIPHHTLVEDTLYETVATSLAKEKVVGWFAGRMEFGPRALGARSILGDARSPSMQSVMNLKIKNRESFRPFAPAILEEHASDYFDLDRPSPYMLLVAPVKTERRLAMTPEQEKLFGIDKLNIPRSDIPAVTHVDYSARVQTVARDDGPFRLLLEAFHRQTGCPVLINTSFNVRGEPIVCTPEDAYRCFRQTAMDVLVLDNCVLYKEEQEGVAEHFVAQAVEKELD
jgi:carbamoyltransferase